MVTFNYLDVPKQSGPSMPKNTTSWIKELIAQNNFSINNLDYIFCSDNYLLGLNQKHLNHNTYTDIITFDNSDDPGIIEADIFISTDRVLENAEQLKQPYQIELHRVIAHGLLHLFGNQDKSAKEKAQMRRLEEDSLKKLKRFM